jgi:hypothetical protein
MDSNACTWLVVRLVSLNLLMTTRGVSVRGVGDHCGARRETEN